MIHQRHRWTDDMRLQDRALHYSASRRKNGRTGRDDVWERGHTRGDQRTKQDSLDSVLNMGATTVAL